VCLTSTCENFESYVDMKVKEGCKYPNKAMEESGPNQICLKVFTKVWPKVDFLIFNSKWDGTFWESFGVLKYTCFDPKMAKKLSVNA